MSEPEAPATDLMPTWLGEVALRRAVSSDGQVYVRAPGSTDEFRLESWDVPRLLDDVRDEELPDWLNVDAVVRHLDHERLRCADCGYAAEVVWFPWLERRCPDCWSSAVELLERRTEPPRPTEFGNLGRPVPSWQSVTTEYGDHVWGRSADGDARMLWDLSNAYRFQEGAHPYLYALGLLARSLADDPACRADPDYFNLLLNVGNVRERYFRMTGATEAARDTLDAFEAAATVADDPVPASLARHSFAIAVVYILDTLEERQAEIATGRPGLRRAAIEGAREALRLAESVLDRDPQGTPIQCFRIQYALADLLRRGWATDAELAEALEILESLDMELAGQLRVYVDVARLETRLLIPPAEPITEGSLQPWADAVRELDAVMSSADPFKLDHRWHWALAIGQCLLRLGLADDARPYLESAVTFTLKDTGFRSDPVVASGDAERYHQAFNALATLYISIGWAFEGLALLETFRGRALDLAAADEGERGKREAEEWSRREEEFFGGMFGPDDTPTLKVTEESTWEQMHGSRFGPFADDYELPGLSERVDALFDGLGDMPTALVSLSLDELSANGGAWVSGVVIRPPGTEDPRCRFATWRLDDEQLAALRSELYRRPGSFRERRLRDLGETIRARLLDPIADHLRDVPRALFVTPSALSNLPLEASGGDSLPRHVACLPAFIFRARAPREERRTSGERLLIVGYHGADLAQAGGEADDLAALFGGRATYLRGEDCTKRLVVEHLNGDYDYIHLICHGTYDPEHPLESALVFRDGPERDAHRLLAREIERLVRFARRPVVTLSACSTALTADSRSNTWTGLPGALLRAGANCVIGTRWPVRDGTAASMMGDFYRQLARGTEAPLASFFAMQDAQRASGRVEDWSCFGYLGLP